VSYVPADVSDAFLELVTSKDGDREMKVKSTVAEPEFTTKDARGLRIKERVSTFTTYYPYAEYRNTNIGRAADLVDGTVLKPGETFSLNDTVGERTRENGFTEGFIISDGIFKEDLGGGVSQMATTTFNAMFFAGLADIEHKPHSFYIDRYPVGREATVAWGAVDLRFRNDTPYGVLISARVTPSTPSTQGVVTVSMYSTKYWDISTSTSDRYNLTPPATRTLTTPDCYPNTGYGGFDVDVIRSFRKAGEDALVRTEKMHTHYIPSDTVVCKPPKGNRNG
jgi:vancomycin resistance protein YoaR